MNLRNLRPPSDLPAKARVPALAVNVALIIVGMALSVAGYGITGWLVLGAALCARAAWAPQSLFGWVLILFLTAGQLTHPDMLTWRLPVLLAGIHLLHILAMLTLELPRRSWLRPGVFLAPLRRFVAIQVPLQALAVVALLVLAPSASGHRPMQAGAVVGAAALAGLALMLLRAPPIKGPVVAFSPGLRNPPLGCLG
jgi:hypothetical protein